MAEGTNPTGTEERKRANTADSQGSRRHERVAARSDHKQLGAESNTLATSGSAGPKSHADLSARLGEHAQRYLVSRQRKSAGELGTLARALRLMSEQLEGNITSPHVRRAADRIEHVSQVLSDVDPRVVVEGAAKIAQREPLLFVGGAFLLGMGAARFLKSSGRVASAHDTPSRQHSTETTDAKQPRNAS